MGRFLGSCGHGAQGLEPQQGSRSWSSQQGRSSAQARPVLPAQRHQGARWAGGMFAPWEHLCWALIQAPGKEENPKRWRPRALLPSPLLNRSSSGLPGHRFKPFFFP